MASNLPPSVVKLYPGYEIESFPWGAASKNLKTNTYDMLFFPDGQELNVENWELILHENGVEFISFKEK